VTTPKRPNIVVFLVDDMGWQDTSVPFHTETTPFNERYRTPNTERLADAGMKFTQAYACPVCSPSRVSLMTGQNAARHRVTNWTLFQNRATDAEHPTLAIPAWNVNGISPDVNVPFAVHARALPVRLRDLGYHTIHVGKAHLGAFGTPGADPRNLGFDVNIAGHAAGGPGSYLGTQDYSAAWRGGDRAWDVPGLEKYHGQDVFLTEALTREAIREVDVALQNDRPFFLYLSHYAVHIPFAEDERFFARYQDAALDHTEAMYAAMIEGMDRSLGDVLDHLEHRGISGETIILFMSDNGGLSAYGRGGAPHLHNLPLSSGKGSAREGGIRVPMMAHWPGITTPGSTCGAPVLIEDFFPTILELSGRPAPVEDEIDGVSFAPLLRGAQDSGKDRAFVWHYPNHWGHEGPGIGPFSAIREANWKLIYYHAGGVYELFDLDSDIGETTNLASDKPIIRNDLAARLRTRLEDVQAQMPVDKQTGAAVEMPR